MGAVAAFLVTFDNAWEHEWESLTSVLEGVTEDEASWQAPCYRDEAAESAGTIRWHVHHIAHCKREYTARLLGDRDAPSPTLRQHATGSFEEDLACLRSAHATEREVIAGLDDAEVTPDVADFLSSIIRHDIWHGGQIALIRRLYRTRGAG